MYGRAIWLVSVLFYVSVDCIPRRRDDHYVEGKHNVEHDHKIFLGQDEKKAFDELTPEQSRLRLSEIVDKIDKNSDGDITKEELRSWIEYVQLKHFHDEVDKNWPFYDIDGNGKISWEEFKNRSYGHTSEHDERMEDKQYRKKRELDKKKWQAADSNDDNMLTKEEYSAYLHPSEYRRMHEVAAEEILSGMDKDDDGFISLDEYLRETNSEESHTEPPKWLEGEKKIFTDEYDKNKDGKLNQEEVLMWLFPGTYNYLDSEALHLMSRADINKDQILTKQEILSHQDVFVGSRATNFGETLKRPTDEL